MSDRDEAEVWIKKIASANKYYKDWSKRYKCDALEKMYEGFQWAEEGTDAYVLNLFYSTIEIKMPSLLFDRPIFRISPKPEDIRTNPELAFTTASNLEDTLNTLITQDHLVFAEEVESAILDSHFRFGIVEVGYSADWIENPNVPRPALKSDYSTYEEKGQIKKKAKTVPVNERIYVKYIPAKSFRVSTIESRHLHRCNWCGYYEFVRLEDILADRNLKNIDKVKYSGYQSAEFFEDYFKDEDRDSLIKSGDYVLIWKIWDNRLKKKFIISETHSIILQESEFDFLPFADLRFKRRLKTFYPLPPMFNAISPQNEINETREANRMHRRRFKRLYQYLSGAVDRDELEKIVNGPDGGLIEVNKEGAITPIQYADIGTSAQIAMQTTKDDFNIVTGTTTEQRGIADRETATQAAITNNRASIRENRDRIQVAIFLIKLAKLAIETVRRKFINTVSVNSSRVNEITGAEIKSVRGVNPLTDLGEETFGFNVTVSIDSMSPVANEDELQKFLKFLGILTQFPQIAFSPILIRETAARVGYKNEQVIKEMQQQAQLAAIGQIEQGVNNLKQNMNSNNGALAQQMQPPNLQQLGNQLSGQGVPING